MVYLVTLSHFESIKEVQITNSCACPCRLRFWSCFHVTRMIQYYDILQNVFSAPGWNCHYDETNKRRIHFVHWDVTKEARVPLLLANFRMFWPSIGGHLPPPSGARHSQDIISGVSCACNLPPTVLRCLSSEATKIFILSCASAQANSRLGWVPITKELFSNSVFVFSKWPVLIINSSGYPPPSELKCCSLWN